MPAPTERLFFAVRPDARTALRIEALAQALCREHGLRGKSLGPERFHVTLHLIGDFPGGVPADVLASALDAARPVAEQASPFHVSLDTVASFTRKRRNMPLVLLGEQGLRDARDLQRDLLAALVSGGLAEEPTSSFTPHLTLLYDDIPLPPCPVEPVAWRADALYAMRSLLGRGRHEVIARLPLGR